MRVIIFPEMCWSEGFCCCLGVGVYFDTVDHQTLLRVLRCRFGVTDAALSWCSSYLSQRTQIFNTNEQLSGPHVVACSVPQGSALGPLKFIGYTEDLADLITNHQLSYHLYADDTQLLGSTSTSKIRSTVTDPLTAIIAVAVVYRPGSAPVLQLFFDELAAVLEQLAIATYQAPIYIAGDFNIRIDRPDDSHSAQFRLLVDCYCLMLHYSSSMHLRGGTLDAMITRGRGVARSTSTLSMSVCPITIFSAVDRYKLPTDTRRC